MEPYCKVLPLSQRCKIWLWDYITLHAWISLDETLCYDILIQNLRVYNTCNDIIQTSEQNSRKDLSYFKSVWINSVFQFLCINNEALRALSSKNSKRLCPCVTHHTIREPFTDNLIWPLSSSVRMHVNKPTHTHTHQPLCHQSRTTFSAFSSSLICRRLSTGLATGAVPLVSLCPMAKGSMSSMLLAFTMTSTPWREKKSISSTAAHTLTSPGNQHQPCI